MSHKFRFSLVAVLTLLAMFIVPQVTMAASQHSVVSAHAAVNSTSLHYYKSQKQHYGGYGDPEDSTDEDSSSWQNPGSGLLSLVPTDSSSGPSSWQSQDSGSGLSSWLHHTKGRHVVIAVRIKCRFFSCNIHSFNGNYIEIGHKKYGCSDGASVSFTATIGGVSHTVRIEANPATPGTINIFIDGATTPVVGTIGVGGVITFPAQTGLGGATSITVTASGIVLAGATIDPTSIVFACI